MQEIHETRGNQTLIDRLVGIESDELRKQFRIHVPITMRTDMQEIHETRGNQTLIDRLVGIESDELRKQFKARRAALEKRIETGETEKATIRETRRIGRNDPCPCGSGVKFKKCCGSRLPDDDERIVQ
jgi:DNA-binding protein Fis